MNTKLTESLKWYTGGEYDELNDALRQGNRLPKHIAMHWYNIQEAFRLTAPSTEPIMVYRGKKSNKIRTIVTPLSTSRTIQGTEDFVGDKCCILFITVSPGTRYIDLGQTSEIPSESEILLPPGGSLVFTGTDNIRIEYPRIVHNDMEVLYVTYIPPASVTIDMSKQQSPAVSSAQIKHMISLDTLVSLISKEEYFMYDGVGDIVEALKLSTPDADEDVLQQAAKIIYAKF
jgi:hypothetical protein